MEILLFVITVLSLGTASVALLNVLRLKRAEELRSEARVAALAAAADENRDLPQREMPSTRPPESARLRIPAANRNVSATLSGFREETRGGEAIGLRDDGGPAGADALFGTVQRDAPASGRLAFVGGLALLVAVGGGLAVLSSSSQTANAPDSAAVAQHNSPIELLSLTHARDASTLTISGLVRNPSSRPKLEGLTAVVSLLDNRGTLLSTKDVPLDYRALAPGEEAPFKVTIPDAGTVAKYRVSFRAGTDVVPHVDRRGEAKFASAL